MADDEGQGKSSWKISHYILAGLCATLVVTAVVTITSIVLSPAQVTFTVTHASRKNLNSVINLMVTIAVYNPSRRCQARYQGVFIDLKNSSTKAGRFSIRANVPNTTFPMDYVRGPHQTLINSTVGLVAAENLQDYIHRMNTTGLTVELTAQVRFKIGVTPTRLYDMKLLCPGVLFTDDNSSTSHANFSCSG